MKKFLFVFNIILFICLMFVAINVAYAEDPIPKKGLVPNDRGQIKTGDYSLDDFVTIVINLSQWILGITGSLALLMFIYGGTMFLISGGSQERVKQAKDIIFGAVIGLAIIFTSYIIIGFVFKATGADPEGTAWSKSDWFTNK